MPQNRTITLIGTGLMGAPIARNLMKAGYPLTVWNRTTNKTATLVGEGAKTAPTAAEAVKGANIVISMLADGYATGSLLSDPLLCSTLRPGTIWIDMSSAKPGHAREQSALLSTLECSHLDAPVSGGTKGATAGTLAIMVGGELSVFEYAKPILSVLGRPEYVGPSGAGQLCKLANQSIVAVTIAAVAEATLLAERGGADPAALRSALRGGFADSVILQQHGERMSSVDFAPGGLSKLQLKDLDNTLAEAARYGLDLPSTQAVRDRFEHLVYAMGGADLDHSALYLELKKRNGLK